jgi:hypothetical protein
MTYPVSSHTVQDIITYCRRLFGDDSSVQILDSDIIMWINMGQMDIATKLMNVQASSATVSVIGQAAYTVPSDVIKMESVYYNSKPLRGTSMDSVQTQFEDLISSQGFPQYWWLWANSINIFPVPDTANVPIVINYIKRPTAVVNGASALGLPDTYYNALCDYVMAKAAELDENVAGSQTAMDKYSATLVNVSGVERSESGAWLVIQEYQYD